MAKSRKARNHIQHLISDAGNQVTAIEGIRSMAPEFFSNLFNHSDYWSIFPRPTVKRRLSVEASSWLYRPVQAGEIKEAAFQLDPNKVPGADGYNATFFQSNWSRVEEEVTHAIQSFFISGKLIKKLNHTFTP